MLAFKLTKIQTAILTSYNQVKIPFKKLIKGSVIIEFRDSLLQKVLKVDIEFDKVRWCFDLLKIQAKFFASKTTNLLS